MATVYPGTIDSFPTSSGTSLLSNPDHSDRHNSIGSAVQAIETVLGTTGVTGLLVNFTATDKPLRVNSSLVMQQTIAGGTINSGVFGTSSLSKGTATGMQFTAGTFTGQNVNSGTFAGGVYGTVSLVDGTSTNQVMVTPTIGTPIINVGSDVTGDIYYRNGGTFSRLPVGSSGQYLTTNGTTPSWGTVTTTSTGIIRLSRTADLSVNNNSETAVGWDVEDEKSNMTHDTVTNNSRITVPATGRYMLTTRVRWLAALGAYEAYLAWYRNGTQTGIIGGGATSQLNTLGAITLSLTASDYIELYVFHSAGSTRTVEGGTAYYKTRLELVRLP